MGSELNKKVCPFTDPEHWVDEHGQALYRYAYIRVAERSTAEDLVQETFLAALQSYDTFQGRSSVRTWLISILRHKMAEYFRKKQQNASTDSEINPSEEDFFENGKWKTMPARWSANPEEQASKKEFWQRLIKCIRNLSPTLADAFILKEMNVMDQNEVCGQLEISETGLWSRLHRARLSLRRCLEKTWFSKLK